MGRMQRLLGCMEPAETAEMLLGVMETVESCLEEFASSELAPQEVTGSVVQAVSLLLNDAKRALVHNDRPCRSDELAFAGNALALLVNSFSQVLLSCVATGPVSQSVVDLVEILRDCTGTVERTLGNYTAQGVSREASVANPLKTYSISEFLKLDPLEQAIILSGGGSSTHLTSGHLCIEDTDQEGGYSSLFFNGNEDLLGVALKFECGSGLTAGDDAGNPGNREEIEKDKSNELC